MTHEGSTIIYVSSTTSQQELYHRVRELQGFSPRESFALRLGGVRLQAPSTRLCDSNAKPYSQLDCEPISLCGGSGKVAVEPYEKLPADDQSETQRILRRGDDDNDLLKEIEACLEQSDAPFDAKTPTDPKSKTLDLGNQAPQFE